MTAGSPLRRAVPPSTVARLPVYLRALDELAAQGVARTSSGELAELAGVGSAQLRRDLSFLGSHGVRGVGYDVEHLQAQVAAELGMTGDLPVVIVGIGNLGHALANYVVDAGTGFRVAALVDADPRVVGTTVAGLVVEDDARLGEVVQREGATLAVLATPAAVAQEVCDRLVAAGVTGILTFVPRVLQVPADVDLRSVDLATELQILAFHARQRTLERG
ncbi:redox-sensing transcriptional repressor Rex [Actinotalea fermentans]|uniref:Redox-sensing transcriptional repressor Rex n=1 Tax=Actinotalea fermentans TaxID=43671 RepID=A0A511Z0G8_9CELL|nr:redox-sensing transcriptional repressor Rex [Actinotalea fermentans]KGM15298.1 REX family transcriptional regulator [Actinotalea fermentans ATCC 43279 = JCM 9966 = DSM 3133]GEN80954.1 redox-sensing transcriptional repressor Rex [Actinotalea fermentans]